MFFFFFFLNVMYILEGYEILWSKGRCRKGGPKFKRQKMTIDVLVSSTSHFHPLSSNAHSP
jgi:hypothetical protein